MSEQKKRILARQHARELTMDELQQVAGGLEHNTGTTVTVSGQGGGTSHDDGSDPD